MSHQAPQPYYGPPPPRRGRGVAWFVAACVAAAVVGGGVALLAREGEPDRPAAASTVSNTPTPSSSSSVSPECRAWIRTELLDDSKEIDATTGYGACGELSEAELQAAIDEVTEELSAEITPEP